VTSTRRQISDSLHATSENLQLTFVELPTHFNSNGLARQEAPSPTQNNIETTVPQIAKMAATATALHAQWSGSTVSISEGNMAGFSCFAVSPYPERTVELAVAPTWNLVFAYAVLNSDLLLLAGHALGTWCHRQRKYHVLDVVVCLSSLDKAIRLGLSQGQEVIYDLKAGREISLSASRKLTAVDFDAEGQ